MQTALTVGYRLVGLVLGLAIALAPVTNAETYKNIGPLDSLADVKARFPKADFKELHPAWAQETEHLYQITGVGMSGVIILKFDDASPYYQESLKNAKTDEERTLWQNLIEKPDEALTVGWVRWMPEYPIALQRFVSKYGPPDAKGFADEDMQPYRTWSRGVTGFLSDDEKYVVRVDYSFTRAELRRAYKARYGFIPDYLKHVQ
jgi:hypothetical protein